MTERELSIIRALGEEFATVLADNKVKQKTKCYHRSSHTGKINLTGHPGNRRMAQNTQDNTEDEGSSAEKNIQRISVLSRLQHILPGFSPLQLL